MLKGSWSGTVYLDDMLVTSIADMLTLPSHVAGKPSRLAVNSNRCFQGSIVLGTGFLIDDKERERLIRKSAHNEQVVFPYLNGDDIATRPDQSPSRWVINFFGWPLSRSNTPNGNSGPVAADYPDCLAIVEERVKPERMRIRSNGMAGTERKCSVVALWSVEMGTCWCSGWTR